MKSYIKAKAKKYVRKAVNKASPYKKSVGAKTLADRIARLERDNKVSLRRIQYSQSTNNLALDNTLGNQITAIKLCDYGSWARLWGADTDDEGGKAARLRKTTIEWDIRCNEPDLVGYSMFVVSLKKDGDDQVSGTPYSPIFSTASNYNQINNRTLLNLKYFNIHYYKRIVFGQQQVVRLRTGAGADEVPGVQATPANQSDYFRKGRISLNYNKGKGLMLSNAGKDWKALGFPVDVQKNYFLVIFSENSSADLQTATMNYNAIHQVDVA